MGANATTSVPVYASGEVLTAANLNITNSGIPVFATTTTRDAAFGGSGEKTLAEGQFAYLEDSNTTQYYDGAAWVTVGTTPGLVYITGTSVTSVAAINVNNCFTSTYTNYRLIFSFTATTDIELQMKMRIGGVDYSGTDYTDYGYYMGAGGAGNLQHVNTTNWTIGYISSTEPVSGSMDMFNPQVATKTQMNGMSGIRLSLYENGRLNTTTQYDGFTIFANTSTITGNWKLYGYSNS